MRIHLVSCIGLLALSTRLSLTRGEMACLFLAIGSVITAEMLNTSLEKLCDFAQKNTNHRIRVIKDMAAGAVLVCAFFAALVGVVVLVRPALWTVLQELWANPLSLGLVALALIFALIFIIVGPVRLSEKMEETLRKR